MFHVIYTILQSLLYAVNQPVMCAPRSLVMYAML